MGIEAWLAVQKRTTFCWGRVLDPGVVKSGSSSWRQLKELWLTMISEYGLSQKVEWAAASQSETAQGKDGSRGSDAVEES